MAFQNALIIAVAMIVGVACSDQSQLSLPTPAPLPVPSPAVPPASETAFTPSTMAVSTSSSHRAVMGVVSIGGASVSRSRDNIQITGTLQQGKDRMGLP